MTSSELDSITEIVDELCEANHELSRAHIVVRVLQVLGCTDPLSLRDCTTLLNISYQTVFNEEKQALIKLRDLTSIH